MKLVYRGHAYEQSSVPVDLVESPVPVRYRGQSYQFSYPRHIPVPQPVLDLKYRGVEYHRNSAGVITPVEPRERRAALETPIFESVKAPVTQARKARLAEAARVHHETIRRRLQHRMDVARQKGDQVLLQQLEHEMQQIA